MNKINKMYFAYVSAPFCTLEIVEENGSIIQVNLIKKKPVRTLANKENKILNKAVKHINEYLYGKRKTFNVPLNPKGTIFQKKVWKALQDIPYGETTSYQEIARKVGCPKGQRAVGMANNKNPIAIMIPCHRVIGKNGALVGYASGVDKKAWLLKHEKKEMLYL